MAKLGLVQTRRERDSFRKAFETTLQWRHYGYDGVSNHQPHNWLLNRSFRRRSKKTSKLRVTGLCVGNSSVTGEFPTQMASNAENVSIWWRHHEIILSRKCLFFLCTITFYISFHAFVHAHVTTTVQTCDLISLYDISSQSYSTLLSYLPVRSGWIYNHFMQFKGHTC